MGAGKTGNGVMLKNEVEVDIRWKEYFEGLLKAIKSLYEGSKCCMRVGGANSEWFQVMF